MAGMQTQSYLLLDGNNRFPLDKERVTIGRDAASDVSIAIQEISSRHLELSYENGAWYVMDCDSLNGTVLDGRPLAAWQKQPLRDGSHLVLAQILGLDFRAGTLAPAPVAQFDANATVAAPVSALPGQNTPFDQNRAPAFAPQPEQPWQPEPQPEQPWQPEPHPEQAWQPAPQAQPVQPAKKKSKALAIVLPIVGGLLVLAAIAFFVLRVSHEKILSEYCDVTVDYGSRLGKVVVTSVIDPDGRKTTDVDTDEDGKITGARFENEDGSRVEYTIQDDLVTEIREYGADGKLTKKTAFADGKRTEQVYDAAGKMTSEKVTDLETDGLLAETTLSGDVYTINEYGADGKLKHITVKKTDGTMISERVNNSDGSYHEDLYEDGRILSETDYNAQGEATTSTVYEYFSDGTLWNVTTEENGIVKHIDYYDFYGELSSSVDFYDWGYRETTMEMDLTQKTETYWHGNWILTVFGPTLTLNDCTSLEFNLGFSVCPPEELGTFTVYAKINGVWGEYGKVQINELEKMTVLKLNFDKPCRVDGFAIQSDNPTTERKVIYIYMTNVVQEHGH